MVRKCRSYSIRGQIVQFIKNAIRTIPSFSWCHVTCYLLCKKRSWVTILSVIQCERYTWHGIYGNSLSFIRCTFIPLTQFIHFNSFRNFYDICSPIFFVVCLRKIIFKLFVTLWLSSANMGISSCTVEKASKNCQYCLVKRFYW